MQHRSPPPLTLVVGNKNYSSWSARPWLTMTELGIPFVERMLKFDSEDWAASIDALSPTGLVPVLWEGEPEASRPCAAAARSHWPSPGERGCLRRRLS